MRKPIFLPLAVELLFFAIPVHAEVETHALLHTFSAHSRAGLNNENFGAGIMVRDGDWFGVVGRFRNSFDYMSNYAMTGWQPEIARRTRLGFGLGIIDGYRNINGGSALPAGCAIVSYAIGRIGAHVAVMPPVRHRGSWKAHLALSWRF